MSATHWERQVSHGTARVYLLGACVLDSGRLDILNGILTCLSIVSSWYFISLGACRLELLPPPHPHTQRNHTQPNPTQTNVYTYRMQGVCILSLGSYSLYQFRRRQVLQPTCIIVIVDTPCMCIPELVGMPRSEWARA